MDDKDKVPFADRDNTPFLNETVRNTVNLLAVLAANAPICVTAQEFADVLKLDVTECEMILINLANDEWIRETEKGFQTLSIKLEKLGYAGRKVLGDYLHDEYGDDMPRARRADGTVF